MSIQNPNIGLGIFFAAMVMAPAVAATFLRVAWGLPQWYRFAMLTPCAIFWCIFMSGFHYPLGGAIASVAFPLVFWDLMNFNFTIRRWVGVTACAIAAAGVTMMVVGFIWFNKPAAGHRKTPQTPLSLRPRKSAMRAK